MSTHDDDEHSSASEDELAVADSTPGAGGSTSAVDTDPSKKKKKKKKSKAVKALGSLVNKVKGKDDDGSNIPDELVGEIMNRVKQDSPEEAKSIDSDEIRRTLAALKIMDVMEGKTGIGGKNKKDIGEHKVCVRQLETFWNQLIRKSPWNVVLENTTCASTRYV